MSSSDAPNDNKVVVTLENQMPHKENDKMEQTITNINNNQNVIIEMCEVKKMIVEALQECPKSIENDCSKLMKDEDLQIKQLKNKACELKLKEHHKQKEDKNCQLESKHLKENAKVIERNRAELNQKVRELQANEELKKICIEEFKEVLQEEKEKKSKNGYEMSTLRKQIQTLTANKETLQSKEKEWEFKDKKIDKLQCNAKDLENSLNLK